MLEEAAAMAGNEVFKRRVEFLRSGVDLVEIQARTHAFADAHMQNVPSREELDAFWASMTAKLRLMRQIAQAQPLAINTPAIAWGSEGRFRRLGWNGYASLSLRGLNEAPTAPVQRAP